MQLKGFPHGSDGKESACNVGDLGSIPGLGRSPGGGHANPLQYSRLENPHEQRSLVGCSPLGRKESDTTEQLSTALHTDLHFKYQKFPLNIFRKVNCVFSESHIIILGLAKRLV